jgi:hypothetical protein
MAGMRTENIKILIHDICQEVPFVTPKEVVSGIPVRKYQYQYQSVIS